VDFAGNAIPVITAESLIICKAPFNRPRDWLNIENITRVREQLEVHYIQRWLNEFVEPNDERILRIAGFFQDYQRRGGAANA
jgi:hypothetical protein